MYILTCIDVFTKWTEAFPLPNKEAAVVARVLVEQIFCRFGVPIALLSDNGNEVDSSIMREICRLLDVDKLRTTFYKASTNAAIERFHRTLNSMIGKIVNDKQTDWDLLLPYVMAAYRSSRHDSTAYTPNFLTLGREVRAPVDIVLGTGPVDSEETYDGFVEDVQTRMRTAFDLVRQHIGEAAQRNKRYYDIRVKPAKYALGQWVYYFNPRRFKGRQDKWSRKYTGPFCIVKVLGPVNVELQLTKRSKPFITHIDKVKPYLGESPKGWVDAVVEAEVAEVVEKVAGEAEISDSEDVENDIASPIDSVLVTQPLAPELVDVVTFSEDQEFRRNRPRRDVRRPARFED